ncbi:MAG: c-type cytochrome [SAR86 cluster bacterium]|jgi:cytochrome c5|nr:c-type cytochrome [SAR86 cluster bacterium]MCS5548036.1 c-type cytochrome [SAR86 cluster bacterium]GIS74653.1 MAG: cytochrome c [Gammaproteobacteria bacterium]GIT32556.1 MAG: cytochrome c [Gammaproteobacteria bacterium]|tara:strand:- start:81 stop:497 length:417 start_codon:yes stop_codon:yes gene_type:complete
MKKTVLFIALALAFATLGLGASEAKKAIEKRIAPVGQVCVEGQDCAQEVNVVSSSLGGMRSGKEVYDAACTTCHAIALAGAPRFGDRLSWGERANEDLDKLVETVTNGLGGMPPMGMCMDCSQEELSDAVQYMLDALD